MARRNQPKIKPEPTTDTDWRIPAPSDKYTGSLDQVPKNGEWYIMAKGLGFTTAEQAARSLNQHGGTYEWGYHVRADDGVLVSDLAVRWIVPTITTTTTTTTTTGGNP